MYKNKEICLVNSSFIVRHLKEKNKILLLKVDDEGVQKLYLSFPEFEALKNINFFELEEEFEEAGGSD